MGLTELATDLEPAVAKVEPSFQAEPKPSLPPLAVALPDLYSAGVPHLEQRAINGTKKDFLWLCDGYVGYLDSYAGQTRALDLLVRIKIGCGAEAAYGPAQSADNLLKGIYIEANAWPQLQQTFEQGRELPPSSYFYNARVLEHQPTLTAQYERTWEAFRMRYFPSYAELTNRGVQ